MDTGTAQADYVLTSDFEVYYPESEVGPESDQ